MHPLHKVDSIDDDLLTNNKYDYVVLAYFSSENLSRAYKVYQLAAMRNRGSLFYTICVECQHFRKVFICYNVKF
jgi:hypothetical protein